MDWRAAAISSVVRNIPFNASNFNATGGGTWTLIAANVSTFQTIKVGHLVHIDFFCKRGNDCRKSGAAIVDDTVYRSGHVNMFRGNRSAGQSVRSYGDFAGRYQRDQAAAAYGKLGQWSHAIVF